MITAPAPDFVPGFLPACFIVDGKQYGTGMAKTALKITC
jgi:hypothetical protein